MTVNMVLLPPPGSGPSQPLPAQTFLLTKEFHKHLRPCQECVLVDVKESKPASDGWVFPLIWKKIVVCRGRRQGARGLPVAAETSS